MIPKTIHYCWLSGGPVPGMFQHCINSWHKILPDYEFILWDKNRFHLAQSTWVEEAYNAKKYAFAADYIRLYAVYNYGGIYLDCDVEVFKRFDDLLHLPYFIGEEAYPNRWEVAAFGSEKGAAWVKQCLDYYEGRHFILEDGSYDTRPMPDVLYEVLSPSYQIQKIKHIDSFENKESVLNVFPNDWFCAHIVKHPDTSLGPEYIVSNDTYCVHHFGNSWLKVKRAKKLLTNVLYRFGLKRIKHQ